MIMRHALIILLTFFISSTPGYAKKNKDTPGLKKIIAIGYADTGYLGFTDFSPEQLSEMFRMAIKKQLEKMGYAPVLAKLGEPEPSTPTQVQEIPAELSDPKKQLSPEDIQKLMAYSQKMMAEMQSYRRPQHQPVAAQALFNFSVRTGESSMDTGTAVGWAELFTQQSLGFADYSSESTKFHVLTIQNDPETGKILDKHATKATSTRINRVAGYQYYTVSNSADHQAAFNRTFSSAVKRVAKWIDKKMKTQAWEGQVFKKKGSQVYLNAGASAGVSAGMRFKLIKRKAVGGRGVDLGTEDVVIGQIEISQVKDKFSIANLVSGEAPVGAIATLP